MSRTVVTTSGPTVTEPASAATPESGGGAAPGPVTRRLLHSGWPPALAVALFAVVALLVFETPPLDIARYAGYLIYGLALPGTLLWRALRGTPRSFVEDVAAGTVLAYAVELLVYFAAAAVGLPGLVAAWPAVVVLAFVTVPSLRRHWRVRYETALPAAWHWAVAGVAVIALAWLAYSGFLAHALSGPGSGNPYVDMPFHLSLAAELKHQFPPKMPFVIDEPMSYHWFVHAHMAASSWTSGVELHEILYRFYAVPLAILTVLLTAILAARVSGRIWAGPVAASLAVFVGSFSPYAWAWVGPPHSELNLFTSHIWGSPTQSYGQVLFLPLLLLVADRLRRAPGGLGQWVMITLLIVATTGGKATFLPLLLGGVGLAGLITLIVRRRIDNALLITAVLTAVAFVYATQVLFGGASAGLKLGWFFSSEIVGAIYLHGPLPGWFIGVITVLILTSWAARGAGVIGILAQRQRWADPVAGMLGGIVLAGLVTYFAFRQPGGSQYYFARSMAPILAVLSAWGAAELVPPERSNRRVAAALLGSALLGGAIMTAVIILGPERIPSGADMTRPWVAFALVRPYLILGAVFAVLCLGLLLLRRRHAALRGISAALVVAFLLGLGLTRLIPFVRDPIEYYQNHGGFAYTTLDSARPIAPGAVEAGRWIRDHSSPDDVVATNSHCRNEYLGNCDNRHFWVAAYTERRVLVEGWGYTPTANALLEDGPMYYVPFWQPEVLADNDRAFTNSTRVNLDRLRDEYGVRWLFVDERFHRPDPRLSSVARERFRAGTSVVYELPR